MNRPFFTSLAFFIGSFAADFDGRYWLSILLAVCSAMELWEALHRMRARLRRDARAVRRT